MPGLKPSRLTATIEGYVARHSLGFQEPIDWLIAVFCPAHVPNILAYYEDRGPRLIDVLQSPAKLRRLDVALAGLVEGLAAALAASPLPAAAALEAVLGVLRLNPRPRLRGASPQTGLSPPSNAAARRWSRVGG